MSSCSKISITIICSAFLYFFISDVCRTVTRYRHYRLAKYAKSSGERDDSSGDKATVGTGDKWKESHNKHHNEVRSPNNNTYYRLGGYHYRLFGKEIKYKCVSDFLLVGNFVIVFTSTVLVLAETWRRSKSNRFYLTCTLLFFHTLTPLIFANKICNYLLDSEHECHLSQFPSGCTKQDITSLTYAALGFMVTICAWYLYCRSVPNEYSETTVSCSEKGRVPTCIEDGGCYGGMITPAHYPTGQWHQVPWSPYHGIHMAPAMPMEPPPHFQLNPAVDGNMDQEHTQAPVAETDGEYRRNIQAIYPAIPAGRHDLNELVTTGATEETATAPTAASPPPSYQDGTTDQPPMYAEEVQEQIRTTTNTEKY